MDEISEIYARKLGQALSVAVDIDAQRRLAEGFAAVEQMRTIVAELNPNRKGGK